MRIYINNVFKMKKYVNIINNMKFLNLLNNDDIDNINRNLDNLLLKYIKNDIKLDLQDYNFLSNNHIDNDFIDKRIKKLKIYIKTLDRLKKYPFIAQRTKEWYEMRKNCLTASDLYEGTCKNNLLLAKKKAGVYIDETDFASIPPLKWGNMFEDMAIRCYRNDNRNVKVTEFGLIQNKDIKNFGASPDGISDLGIMLEIKCPYSRKIQKNNIPEKYYYQIQGQLAVCCLNECDYIECEFKTLESDNDYIENDSKYFGIIAEYYNEVENIYKYLYSDNNLSKIDTFTDIDNKIKNFNEENFIFKKKTKWYLNDIYVQRIHFNEELWKDIYPKIGEFWLKVNDCKSLPIEYKKKQEPVKYKFIDDKDT